MYWYRFRIRNTLYGHIKLKSTIFINQRNHWWAIVKKSYGTCHVILSCFFSSTIQVAVYTRKQLNIRITANFLLALAASQPPTKPHVRRYFCAAVQLPSDWLEVVRIYNTVSACCLLGSISFIIYICLVFNTGCLSPVFQYLTAHLPEESNGGQVQGVQWISVSQIQHTQTSL